MSNIAYTQCGGDISSAILDALNSGMPIDMASEWHIENFVLMLLKAVYTSAADEDILDRKLNIKKNSAADIIKYKMYTTTSVIFYCKFSLTLSFCLK